MKRIAMPLLVCEYQDGTKDELTWREASDRLSGWYKDMNVVKKEILAGRALHSGWALYYAKDWKERSNPS